MIDEKSMTIKECIFQRRTVRKYNKEKIPENILCEIIEAGLYAPSACNFQAWKVIVLEDDTKRDFIKLYGNGPRGGKPMIEDCQQGILMTYRNDLGVSGRRYNDYIQSAAAAIQNMILMASSLGVGCCWICDLPDENGIKRLLEIPENYDVIAFVSMGYPITGATSTLASQRYHYGSEWEYKQHKRRYTFEQFVSKNRFTSVNGDSTFANYPLYDWKARLKEKIPALYGIIQVLKKRETPNASK